MRHLLLLVLALPVQDEVESPLPEPARERPRALLPARAPAGTWDGFFADHQPDPGQLAEIEPRLLQMGEWARKAYAAADYPAAVDLCLSQLELLPDFPPTLLLLGSTCFRLRRYSDAAAILGRFLEVAPSELWRTQALGHALQGLGRAKEARDHYAAVLGVLPGSVEARRGLALCLDQLGDQEQAADELAAVVAARPDHAAAWTALGRVRFDLGLLEGARDAVERAQELAPHGAEAWFIAARVAWDQGRDEDAEALEARWRELADRQAEIAGLRNRLLFNPRAPGLLTALAEELSLLGDRAALVPVLERLVAVPGDPEQRLERGGHAIRCLARVDPDAARSNLEALAALHPGEERLEDLARELEPPPAHDPPDPGR